MARSYGEGGSDLDSDNGSGVSLVIATQQHGVDGTAEPHVGSVATGGEVDDPPGPWQRSEVVDVRDKRFGSRYTGVRNSCLPACGRDTI